MTIDRRAELLRRAGRDPVRYDKRPLHAILDDEVPYQRWIRERELIKRAGYDTWQKYLLAMARRRLNRMKIQMSNEPLS